MHCPLNEKKELGFLKVGHEICSDTRRGNTQTIGMDAPTLLQRGKGAGPDCWTDGHSSILKRFGAHSEIS